MQFLCVSVLRDLSLAHPKVGFRKKLNQMHFQNASSELFNFFSYQSLEN
jgi:hypothetical protein